MKNTSSTSLQTEQQPQGNFRHETEFKRKVSTQGFSDFQKFDDFIQNSLDKFKFVDPMPEMYEATGNDANFIISHKSTIPDLVIWNKTFNKNECFEGADYNADNPFPRFQFYLRVKTIKPGDPNQKKKKEKKVVKEKPKIKPPSEKSSTNLKGVKKNSITQGTPMNSQGNNSFGENDNSQEDIELVKAFNEIKLGPQPHQNNPMTNNAMENNQIENEENFEMPNEDMKNLKGKDPLMFDFDINNLRGEDNTKDKNSIKTNPMPNNQNFDQFNQDNMNKEDPNVFQNFMNKDYENMFFNNSTSNQPPIQNKEDNNMFNILSSSNQQSQQNQMMLNDPRSSSSSSLDRSQKKKKKDSMKGQKKPKVSSKGSFRGDEFQNNPNQNFNPQGNFFPPNQFQEKQPFFDNNPNQGNMNNFPMSPPNMYQNNFMLQQQQQNEILLNIVANYFEKKGWIMIGNDGRIMAQFTSFELFQFLTEKLNSYFNIAMIAITDIENNLVFTGDKIYYILSQTLPIIIQAKQNQLMMIEQNNYNNNKKNKKKKSKGSSNNLFGNEPSPQEMQNHYNIHLQYIANDINFNNYPVNMMPPMNTNPQNPNRGNMGMNGPQPQNMFDMDNNNMDYNPSFNNSFKEHTFNQMQMMTSGQGKGGIKKKKNQPSNQNQTMPMNTNMDFGFMKDEQNMNGPSGGMPGMNFSAQHLDNVFDDDGGHF